MSVATESLAGALARACVERIEAFMTAPLTARCEQKALNIGLFDEDGRAQLDMLDFIRTAERGASSSTQTKE